MYMNEPTPRPRPVSFQYKILIEIVLAFTLLWIGNIMKTHLHPVVVVSNGLAIDIWDET